MSNRINIDDLLKQELTNLQADAPADVWQNLDSKLNSAAKVQHTNADVVSNSFVGKSAWFGLKTILITTTIATLAVVAYQLVSRQSVTETKLTKVETPLPTSSDAKQQPIISANDNATAKTENASSADEPVENSVIKINRGIESKGLPSQQVAKQESTAHEQNENKPAIKDEHEPVKPNPSIKSSTADTKSATLPHKEVSDTDKETSAQPIKEEENYIKPEVPNVFTPNGDGMNDQFVITIEQDFIYDLKITNLKGEVVFESKDKNKHWDGIHQFTGVACEPGVYVLAFRYQVLGMKEAKVLNSKVILKQ